MEVVDGSYWSHSFSMISIGGVSLALLALGCIALYLAQKHGEAARRAHIAAEKKVGLFVGEAFVTGVTETRDQAPAIRVEITQHGKETKNKRGYNHTWTEVERTQSTRSFCLRIPGDMVVYVEPGPEVFLIDDMVERQRVDGTTRVMSAELSHGESVTIEGVLTREMRAASDGKGDYRGQRESWVLRPPSQGTMVVSTEPLPARHEKRARFWMLTCAASLFLLVLGNAALYVSGFWPLVMHGECNQAEVIDHRFWTTRGRRGHTVHHTAIVGQVAGLCEGGEGRTPIGTVVEEEVSTNYTLGQQVPFQIAVDDPQTYRFGSGVGLSSLEWWILTIATALFFFLAYGKHRSLRAWYEGKLVQEYEGRLE